MFGNKLHALGGLFAVILIANLLLVEVAMSIGLEGEFNVSSAWESLIGFFGGIASLLAILAFLGIVALVYFGGVKLSEKGRHQLVGVLALVALFVGGFILFRWFNWGSLQFGGGSVIFLIVFTLLESVAAIAVLSSLNNFERRPKKAAATTN